MTEEELINDGWKKEYIIVKTLYIKTINGFHYELSKEDKYDYNNLYEWSLHIDTPDYRSIANIEVDSLEHIYKIAEIYKV